MDSFNKRLQASINENADILLTNKEFGFVLSIIQLSAKLESVEDLKLDMQEKDLLNRQEKNYRNELDELINSEEYKEIIPTLQQLIPF